LAENLQGVLEYQTRWCCDFIFTFYLFYNHGDWFKYILVLCQMSQVRFRVLYLFNWLCLTPWYISNAGLDWPSLSFLFFLLTNGHKLMVWLGMPNSKVWRTLLYIFLTTLVVILLGFISLVYVVKQHRLIWDFHFCFSCKQMILCWSLILKLEPLTAKKRCGCHNCLWSYA
jgi:hypothetical protein